MYEQSLGRLSTMLQLTRMPSLKVAPITLTTPVTLTFELDTFSLQMNRHANYFGQRLNANFISTVKYLDAHLLQTRTSPTDCATRTTKVVVKYGTKTERNHNGIDFSRLCTVGRLSV